MKQPKIYYKRPLAKFKGARLAWDFFERRYGCPVLNLRYYPDGKRIWFANIQLGSETIQRYVAPEALKNAK